MKNAWNMGPVSYAHRKVAAFHLLVPMILIVQIISEDNMYVRMVIVQKLLAEILQIVNKLWVRVIAV